MDYGKFKTPNDDDAYPSLVQKQSLIIFRSQGFQ